jgi:hypothetical protein
MPLAVPMSFAVPMSLAVSVAFAVAVAMLASAVAATASNLIGVGRGFFGGHDVAVGAPSERKERPRIQRDDGKADTRNRSNH